MILEMFAVPQLTPRLGVRLFQRIGSVFEVPTYFLFPVLSTVSAAGFPVAFASLVLLLMCYVCSNTVRTNTVTAGVGRRVWLGPP